MVIFLNILWTGYNQGVIMSNPSPTNNERAELREALEAKAETYEMEDGEYLAVEVEAAIEIYKALINSSIRQTLERLKAEAVENVNFVKVVGVHHINAELEKLKL